MSFAPPARPPWSQLQEAFDVYVTPPPPAPACPLSAAPLLSPLEKLQLTLRNSSDQVFLLGDRPQNLLRDYIGEYRRLTTPMNTNRFVYRRSSRNTNLFLWHDGFAWIIGPEEDIGARGWIRAESRAALPELVGSGYPHDGYWHDAMAKFTIGDGALGWLPAPGLRFAAGAEALAEALAHEDSELRTLTAGAEMVYVVGSTPCGLWREWLGAYRMMREEPLQSGRFTYVQEASEGKGDGARMLWYTDGVSWRLGAAEFVGSPRGPLKVRDASLLPEAIENTFEVGDGSEGSRWDMTDGRSGWIPAPHIRVLSGSAGRAAAEAEGLPICVSKEERLMERRLRGACGG